jgi:hypothetical protein
MSARNKPTSLLGLTLLLGAVAAEAQLPVEGLQLKTLFTTPEERALIDRNRYRPEPRVRKPEPVSPAPQPEPAPATPMVTVEKEYRISGISINADGADVAWINDEQYEDGERIDGLVRLRINAREGRLKLIAPGGKAYVASAGDTVIVKYRKPADQ